MATKKPKRSLSKLADYLEEFKRSQNRLLKLQEKCGEERFFEEVHKLEAKLINYIKKTDLPEGVPSALVYTVCKMMAESPRNNKAADYIIPLGVAYRVVMSYAKTIYDTKRNFLAAPLSIGPRIQDPHMTGPMYMGFGIMLDECMMADASNTAEYALMQKLFANFVANAGMPAKEFVKKFGSISCDDKFEMVRLHNDFANTIWEVKPAEPKPTKVLDMPGQPVSHVEVYKMEDILGKK